MHLNPLGLPLYQLHLFKAADCAKDVFIEAQSQLDHKDAGKEWIIFHTQHSENSDNSLRVSCQ
jgi:hypothetical protein